MGGLVTERRIRPCASWGVGGKEKEARGGCWGEGGGGKCRVFYFSSYKTLRTILLNLGTLDPTRDDMKVAVSIFLFS